MTRKADFNAEEWSLLLGGPPLAGLRVLTAERGGTIRESMQMGKVYAEARAEQGSSELLDEIIAEQPALNPAEIGSAEDVPEKATQRLREAVDLLEQKATPEETEDYKQFVLDLAQRIAGAHKEGGVLGIGGKEISDSEQAAIDEIASTLGINSSAPSDGT